MKILKRIVSSVNTTRITNDDLADTFMYSVGYEDVSDIFYEYLADKLGDFTYYGGQVKFTDIETIEHDEYNCSFTIHKIYESDYGWYDVYTKVYYNTNTDKYKIMPNLKHRILE